jgi:hypothetical protein
MIITSSSKERIYRLDIDADVQKSINKIFSNYITNVLDKKEMLDFDCDYKLDDNECFKIKDYELPEDIIKAINNPIGIEKFEKIDKDFPEIKVIFVGNCVKNGDNEECIVAFQVFRKNQYISNKHINLIFENNIFRVEKNFGISILKDVVDCFFLDGNLMFENSYFARQALDLRMYFIEANNKEINDFSEMDILDIANKEQFKKNLTSRMRRKIKSILNSKVLESKSASNIKELAKKIGIKIKIKSNKIVIPKEKIEIEKILSFLDEEAYKGVFTENTYLANSKRKIK